MWAGAHVRPIPGSTPQLKREAAWLKTCVAELRQHLAAEPFVGIHATPGEEYLEAPDEVYRNLTKEQFEQESGLEGFRVLTGSDVPPGVKLAFAYDTFCVNPPLYCQSLLRKFVLAGGKTIQRDLRTEAEAFALAPNVKLVVNASGVGFADPKCFPTRGELLFSLFLPRGVLQASNFVSGQTVITDMVDAKKTVTRQNADGTWNFLVPRGFNGGTIVGGTKEPNDWSTEARPETREYLLQRGRGLRPFASATGTAKDSLNVIADVVGRRPTREGGVRLEKEVIGDNKDHVIIHAYGTGGRGYELSWGIASEVATLVEAELRDDKSRSRL